MNTCNTICGKKLLEHFSDWKECNIGNTINGWFKYKGMYKY